MFLRHTGIPHNKINFLEVNFLLNSILYHKMSSTSNKGLFLNFTILHAACQSCHLPFKSGTYQKNLTKDSPMHAASLETGLDKKILDY